MVLSFQEFSAWITIEGQAAEEYAIEQFPEKKTVKCWIPSQVDRTFQVHWKDSQKKSSTDGFVVIDGRKCGGKVISSDKDKPDTTCKTGIRTESNTVVPFKFSSVNVTDDETRADFTPNAGIIGTIELCIFRVHVKHREAHITRKAHQDRLLDERAVKGIQHQTTFGEAVTGESRDAVRVDQLSPSPVARFCFQYRPIDMLQADGIAPKSNIIQQRVEESVQNQKLKKEEPSIKLCKGSHAVLGSLDKPILVLDDEDSLPTPQSPPPFHARTRFVHCSGPKKEEPHTETLPIPNDGSSKEEPIIIDDDEDMMVEVSSSFPPPNPSSPASSLTIKPEPASSSFAHGVDGARMHQDVHDPNTPALSSSAKRKVRTPPPPMEQALKKEDGAPDRPISVADPTKGTRDPRLSASSKRARTIPHGQHGPRLQSMDVTEDMDQTLALDPVDPNSSLAAQDGPSFSNHQTNLTDTPSLAGPQDQAEHNSGLQDDPETISLRARLSELKQKRLEREQEKLRCANMSLTGS